MSHWTDSPEFDPSNPYAVNLDDDRPLDHAHRVFTRWLGAAYDLQALDVVLASAAVQHLDGDPVWLLVISGAGNAKTETVAPLAGAGALVESAIASEGALLSATSKKETAKDATGGLLRKIGSTGTLVLKDFTTILSMNRDMRAAVLAALREIYDGHWTRNVGTDGGRTLDWSGRLTLIGAATTAYDTHHSVIAAMGDRFALVRTDSKHDRRSNGMQALRNVGHEDAMRHELAQTAGQVLATVDTGTTLPEHMWEPLFNAADLVTLARTAVDRDYGGEVTNAHQPEAPTRFTKMLGQVVRGHLALGGTEHEALNLALRVAHDSVPPLRLEILKALQARPGLRTVDITKLLQKPRNTVRRELDALHVLGLVTYDVEPYKRRDGQESSQWVYELADGMSPLVLEQRPGAGICPEKSVHARRGVEEQRLDVHLGADISGQEQGAGATNHTEKES